MLPDYPDINRKIIYYQLSYLYGFKRFPFRSYKPVNVSHNSYFYCICSTHTCACFVKIQLGIVLNIQKIRRRSIVPRCIVHFGMHKTGSTSIQHTLADYLESPKFYYMNLGSRTRKSRNHSNELAIAFRSNPLTTKAARTESLNEAQIVKRRERVYKIISRQIEKENNVENFIFSAEDLCHFNKKELQKFKTFLSTKINDFLVVGYVRTPKSFMESVFQQRLKSGVIKLDFEDLYPDYKRKFEKFGTVFGWDNIQFWLFDPKTFPDGCVVQDFCKRLNISMRKENIVRINESLSKEAISLLYTYRLYGPGYGFSEIALRGEGNRVIKETRRLAVCLSNFKGNKFRFSSSFVQPILSRHHEDIAWIEEKLGLPLEEDLEKDNTTAIKTEKDLLKFAPEATYWLAEQLGAKYVKSWHDNITPQQVAEWMHLLRLKLSTYYAKKA